MTITVFAMTQKGYAVVDFITQHFPRLLHSVVIGRDPALENDYSAQLQALCETRGISWSPREACGALSSEYALAVSWRWLLDVPDNRLIVLHDSPLPRYRGFAPMVNALINGERELGVTALFGVSEYDRGDVICQSTTTIDYPMTIQEAIEHNMQNYLAVVRRVCDLLERGQALPRMRQVENDATYSIWRDADDYRIDWSQSASAIRRFVDAVGAPYAGAQTNDGEQCVFVDAVEEVPDVRCELRDCGKVIFLSQGRPVVICGSGLVRVTAARVQAEDGSYASYLPLQRFRVRFR
ncbi:formyltransferase family protein [Ramlibacter sp. AN1015]|uniref:methionyl-tRNA formyltransferase n=1 Tax=Ramlibacter sp. AN1015 TaxID=3133428 RepID=UPI0030BC7DC2